MAADGKTECALKERERERGGREGKRAFPNFKQRGGGGGSGEEEETIGGREGGEEEGDEVKRKRKEEGEELEERKRMRRGGEEEMMKWRSSPEQLILLQRRGGGAQEGFFLSFVQQEAPASLCFSSQEETDVSFGVPPPPSACVGVLVPPSLSFFQCLAEARERAADAFSPSHSPGVLLRHRHRRTRTLHSRSCLNADAVGKC